MKLLIKYSALLFTLFTLTSCFDIMEEIDMKDDGSGAYKLTLNASRSKTKLNTLVGKKIDGRQIPSKSKMEETLQMEMKRLNAIDGISGAWYNADWNNYVVSIHLSFKNTKSLNIASSEMLKRNKANASSYNYSFDGKTFKRTYKKSNLKTSYNKLKANEKEIFSNSVFTSIIRFDKKTISSEASNKKGTISKNNKAFMQKFALTEIINNSSIVESSIIL